MDNSVLTVHSYLASLFPTVTLYFQPPETLKLTYPCIIYSIENIFTRHADNRPYKIKNRYSLMLITRTLDETLNDILLSIESARFERLFIGENLYHFIVTIHTFL